MINQVQRGGILLSVFRTENSVDSRVDSGTETSKSSISLNKKQKKTGNIDNTTHELDHEDSHNDDCTHIHKSTSKRELTCQTSNLMASSNLEVMDTQDSFSDPVSEIERLKGVVRTQNQEIIELKSQLDKFQALFQFSGITSGSGALTIPSNAAVSAKKRTRTRLFGISAEPGPADIAGGDKVIEQVPTFPKDDS